MCIRDRSLTVRENLGFIARIHGSDKKRSKQRAEDSISSFEVSTIAEEKAKDLSGGWQRRLSIVMAVISQPQILFLDEPTLGFDAVSYTHLDGENGDEILLCHTVYIS